MGLAKWWRALDELIFPPNPPCPLCGQRASLLVGACQSCLHSLAIGWKEGEAYGYPHFSLFPYQGFARDLVHKMKFQSGYEIACTLGKFLGLASREEPRLAQVDLLVPVPLHPSRMQERGFNQAGVLADKISRALRRPINEHVVRIRQTAPQSGLAATTRKKNLQGAFAVLPGADFQGKQCLIVDDVITSGYTFSTVARVIEQYGGKPLGVFASRTEIYEESEHSAQEL